MNVNAGSTVDTAEVDKFAAMADRWWDADGPFKPLHALNPARLAFLRDRLGGHFRCDDRALRPFAGLRFIDIGCGGGLITEPLARLGAEVVGVDAAAENIEVAQHHAAATGLKIDYRADTAEALAAAGERFDAVIAMEVVEHVADVSAFLAACRTLVKPGGAFAGATLNRTLRSYLTAIVGAEYVLRWLPRGTHDWVKFLTPAEMTTHLLAAGFARADCTGLTYDLLRREWGLSGDTSINYLVFATA